MKTILVFVSTLDGKITKWGQPDVKVWSSQSDKDYFKNLWRKSPVIIMGSNTYKAEPVKPTSNRLVIVMTQQIAKYKASEIPGLLEFTNESPENILARLENSGFNFILIVGGAKIATSFLKKYLIDELWLTIEPKIFGTGGNFVIDEKLDINLNLITTERVNEQGTLINKYLVIKPKST